MLVVCSTVRQTGARGNPNCSPAKMYGVPTESAPVFLAVMRQLAHTGWYTRTGGAASGFSCSGILSPVRIALSRAVFGRALIHDRSELGSSDNRARPKRPHPRKSELDPLLKGDRGDLSFLNIFGSLSCSRNSVHRAAGPCWTHVSAPKGGMVPQFGVPRRSIRGF